jgi:hypothetical protein
MATNLQSLIIFRVLQGIAGGGLQPCAQGALLDAFPKEKHGTAMTAYAIAILFAPIAGPTLGGWITDSYSWRWLFFINIPTGLLALAMCGAVLRDPPYLVAQRAESWRNPRRFDFVGLGLITIGLASLEVVLSKGQEWDWLGDPFFRVHWLVAGVVLGLSMAVWWELRVDSPVVDLRPLADRNFAASAVILFCAYGVLYGFSTTLPRMLMGPFGYDALNAGLVMSPSGIFALMMLPVVAGLIGRGFDARWLVVAGTLLVAAGCFWMSQMNLFIGPGQIVWPRVVRGIGQSILFSPLNVVAYATLSPQRRGDRPVRLLEERGGKRRHVNGKGTVRAPRAVPLSAPWRWARPAQPQPRRLPGRTSYKFPGAHRRPGEGRLDGLAVDLRRPGPASPVDGLLRLFLDVQCARRGDRSPRPVDETTRGQDGCARGRGLTPRAHTNEMRRARRRQEKTSKNLAALRAS